MFNLFCEHLVKMEQTSTFIPNIFLQPGTPHPFLRGHRSSLRKSLNSASGKQRAVFKCVIEQWNRLDIEADLQKPIATGSFGDVFFGTLRSSNEPVVLKRARETGIARRLFSVERRINRKLDSEDLDDEPEYELDEVFGEDEVTARAAAASVGIHYATASRKRRWPKFLGDYVRDSQTFLVWKRDGDGLTLEDYLRSMPSNALSASLCVPFTPRAPMRPLLFVRIVRGLLLALRDMHAKGVVHRDVKPSNVLIVPDAVKTVSPRMLLNSFGGGVGMGADVDDDAAIRLIDFGSACEVRGLLWSRGINTLDPLYAAPETRLSLLAPTKFDVFSVAMVGCAVLFPSFVSAGRRREFRNALEDFDFDLERYRNDWLRRGIPTEVPSTGLDAEYAALFNKDNPQAYAIFDLLCGMLRKSPQSRLSIDAALYTVASI